MRLADFPVPVSSLKSTLPADAVFPIAADNTMLHLPWLWYNTYRTFFVQYPSPVWSIPKGITSPLHKSHSKKCPILPFIPRRTGLSEIIEIFEILLIFFPFISTCSLPIPLMAIRRWRTDFTFMTNNVDKKRNTETLIRLPSAFPKMNDTKMQFYKIYQFKFLIIIAHWNISEFLSIYSAVITSNDLTISDNYLKTKKEPAGSYHSPYWFFFFIYYYL